VVSDDKERVAIEQEFTHERFTTASKSGIEGIEASGTGTECRTLCAANHRGGARGRATRAVHERHPCRVEQEAHADIAPGFTAVLVIDRMMERN
jgi:hypothetical protein